MTTAQRPMLIYDGACGFCTASADYLASNLAAPEPRVVSWQELGEDELGRLGLSLNDVSTAAWWIDEDGKRWRGHLAIAQGLIACRGWRRPLGRALMFAPLRPVGAGVYWLVARYRRFLPAPKTRRRAA